jgi:hypothetical protein
MKTMPDDVTFQEKIVFKSKSVFNSLDARVNVFFGCIISRNFYRSINIKTNLFHMKVVDKFETKNSDCHEGSVNITYVFEKFLEYLLDT